MGTIRDQFMQVFRDFSTDGVASSGLWEPAKSDIRALGQIIEQQLGVVGLGTLLSAAYPTKAALDADLAHDADAVAIVYADATDLNNDLYLKVGAAGSGSWTLTSTLHNAINAVGAPFVAAATAQADRAAALFNANLVSAAKRPAVSFFPTSSVQGGSWVALLVGTDIPAGKSLAGFHERVAVGTGATLIRYAFYSRPIGNDLTAAPGAVGDTLLATTDLSLTAAGLTAGGDYGDVYPTFTPFVTAEDTVLIVEREARDGSGARKTIAFGYRTTAITDIYRRGYARSTTSASYTAFSSGFGIAYDFYESAPLIERAQQTERRVDDSQTPTVLTTRTLGQVEGANEEFVAGASSYGGFAAPVLVGRDIAPGVAMRRFGGPMAVSGNTTQVRLSLWRRPAGNDLTAIALQETDVQIADVWLSLSAAGLVNKVERMVEVMAALPAPLGSGASGDLLIICGEAYDSAGNRCPIGWANQISLDNTAVYNRGWFRSNLTTNTVFQAIGGSASTGRSLAWRIEGDARIEVSGTRDRVLTAAATVSGYTVTLDTSKSFLIRHGALMQISGAVTLDAPTTGTVTIGSPESVVLTTESNAGTGFANSSKGRLANANVSNLTVKDASTLATLVEGTDFKVNREQGRLALVSAASDRNVTVAYAWSRRRYDLICWDPEARALVVVKGTERIRDLAEFLPTLSGASRIRDFAPSLTANTAASSTLIPLFVARVSTVPANATTGAAAMPQVRLIPFYDAEGRRRPATAIEIDADYRLFQRLCPRTMRKLRAGITPIFAAYGHSIPAMSNTGSALTANGVFRDIGSTNMLQTAIASDVIAALTLYDHGDGGGLIHTHVGYMWALFAKLNAAFGVNIGIAGTGTTPSNQTYLNFSIPGSFTGTGSLSANNTSRLAQLLASGADCVVVDFGANEIGSAATEANIVSLVAAIRAAGMECVVMAQNWWNSFFKSGPIPLMAMNRALRRAATYAGDQGAAFFDADHLYGRDNRSVLGLHPHDFGGSDVSLHPGIYEQTVTGYALADRFIGT